MADENSIDKQLQELDEIIYSNVKSVASKGTRIEYQSITDALKAKELLERKTARRKSFRVYDVASHDKGL